MLLKIHCDSLVSQDSMFFLLETLTYWTVCLHYSISGWPLLGSAELDGMGLVEAESKLRGSHKKISEVESMASRRIQVDDEGVEIGLVNMATWSCV